MKKLLLLPLLSIVLLTGCYNAVNHTSAAAGEIKVSDDGFIKYKIVKIEGERFVATQGANGIWTLAGPLK